MTDQADPDSIVSRRRNPQRRVLVVVGVAGGTSCAARLRRLDESVEIAVFDRGPFVSFANCGLPYRRQRHRGRARAVRGVPGDVPPAV